MDNIHIKLHKFNNVLFDDEAHVYTINGKKLISATTLKAKFVTPFDDAYWGNYSAVKANFLSEIEQRKFKLRPQYKFGTIEIEGVEYPFDKIPTKYHTPMTPHALKEQWKLKGVRSTILGSAVHEYIEFWYNNKVYPTPIAIKEDEELLGRYNKSIQLFKNFYNKTKHVLIPIKCELVLGDEETLIGGMIDILFWNVRDNEYQIWDWKTNEEISTENRWDNLLGIFKHLQATEISEYSIQTYIYRELLHRVANINVGKCYICHLGSFNEEFKVYKMIDVSKEVGIIFDKIKSKRISS